ncbi:MAG: tRNA preQ1(34) S-adenosylmethionine ribosyltransferase-isomerase QueA [Spirochaetaceae bacterium]|jgi:S-adenosylmethionine:tRNA ribosyltransferase-isomerase|nr:tRNA preQ1(34) S-adenosylmethionine ribosyltransferase-isomerase QueA [Spirochaetaceae bacterium]
MRTADFFFSVPPELVAQRPPPVRGESRLLVVSPRAGGEDGELADRRVADLPDLLEEGSLLVFNNSRVRKARLCGVCADSGRQTEFLLLDEAPEATADERRWTALCKNAAGRRAGSRYLFPEGLTATVLAAATPARGQVRLEFSAAVDDAYLDRCGHIPLPPYIKRPDEAADAERYQTVFAAEHGSVAAPTAGLHFSPELLAACAARGIECVFITLHVGLGTFLPVREELPENHRMHEERFFISEEAAARIGKAAREKRKVVAVGTTALRTLESAACSGGLRAGAGRTDIFIHGDYPFRVASALFTNFHTPCSTLLMLAASFAGRTSSAEAGRRCILNAYDHAIRHQYRFFSYGDAMLIV